MLSIFCPVGVSQWSSTRGSFAPQGQCLQTFFTAMMGVGVVASAWWTETRDAAQHPARIRAAPTIKNDLVQNVSRSEFE